MFPKLSWRAIKFISDVILSRIKLKHVSTQLVVRNYYGKYLVAYYKKSSFKQNNTETNV